MIQQQQAQKIKPHLCLTKEIDSLRSFRCLSIKNYKSLSKLKLVKQSITNLQFHKVSRIKSLKHLDLTSFNTKNSNTTQFKLFLKRFSKVQQFSGNQSLLPAFILFKDIKGLYVKAEFKDLTERFLSQLQHSKIKTLHFTHLASDEDNSEVFIDLSAKHLPPTLENLSLLWSGYPVPPMVSFNAPFALGHLRNLQRLELGIPVESDTFKDLIKTIQEPLNLKSLRFNIIHERSAEPEEDEIGEFLRGCCNLEELNIGCDISWMIEFYSETENMKLKKLAVKQFVDGEDIMAELGELLQHQQNNLESLSLNLTINSDGESLHVKSWLDPLFTNLKLLKSVKRLELKLTHFTHSESRRITSALAKVIEELDGLEEIDIEQISGDFNKNVDMFEALQKHSKSLRSLKMSLEGSSCSEKIIQTLKKLPRLEHLTLRNFGVQDLKFFLDLRDIVCEKNQYLNSVEITNVKRPKGAENTIEMLKDIIRKSTMNEFCYLESWRPNYSAEFGSMEVLNLPDVIREVQHFKRLQFFSGACEPPFFEWDFDMYKWT